MEQENGLNIEKEPHLMPKQSEGFNGDIYIQQEFLNIKKKFNIDTVVECGSAVGGTAKWLGKNFSFVFSIEINNDFLKWAVQKCEDLLNVKFILGDTTKILPTLLILCDNNTIFWIDSHWGQHFPLFDELKIIKASGLKPVIAIHDCVVPNIPELGYDSYNGIDISYDNIKIYLDDIYGENGYDYYYNDKVYEDSAKRGIIYITPK
jgi:hypothetical protein